MGMDAYIYRAHNKKEIEFWLNSDTEYFARELWYGRKFWDLHTSMSFLQDFENGDIIELTKDNVREMLQYAAYHRDYMGGFESVPELCEIYNNWDNYEEEGWHYYYTCDW